MSRCDTVVFVTSDTDPLSFPVDQAGTSTSCDCTTADDDPNTPPFDDSFNGGLPCDTTNSQKAWKAYVVVSLNGNSPDPSQFSDDDWGGSQCPSQPDWSQL